MLLARKKYRLSYLASITVFLTVFNLVFAPWFFGFESNYIQKAKASAVTWVAGATGTWETGANWSTGAVPTVSDDVTISSTTGNIAVTLSTGQTANFSSLSIGGDATYSATTTFVGNVGTGGTLTISSKGNFVQQNVTQQIFSGAVTIASGGVLTHTANTTAQSYNVNISAASIDVQSGGSINADGKGYTGGTGNSLPGNGPGGGTTATSAGAGGSHGGDGGNSSDTTASVAYCDVTNPATLGSGGAAGSNGAGGNGGGAIILNASGTMTVNGTVTANGTNGASSSYGAGGAGGAVKITAATVAGTPQTFSLNGGSGGGQASTGGGAGGCVLLSYTATNSITPTTQITVSGGAGDNQNGGAGIVYTKKTGTNGDLFLLKSGNSGAGSTQVQSSMTVDSLTMTATSTYILASGKTLVLQNASPFSSGDATGNLQIKSGGIFTPTSTVNFTVASTTLEIYRGGMITSSSTLNVVLDYGSTLLQTNFTTNTAALPFSSLFIKNGATVTHTANTTTQSQIINLTVASSTLAVGGLITVNGKGYMGAQASSGHEAGYGPGGGSAPAGGNAGSGGGHGGVGGNGGGFAEIPGGPAYCVSTTPDTIGSSGGAGSNFLSGAGGGLILFNIINTFTFYGSITANASASTGLSASGGAGGGVYITAGTVVGTPTSFTANGSAGDSYGGSGGGGCIAVGYRSSSSIGSATVAGGVGGHANGSAGTFYTGSINTAPTISSLTLTPAKDGTGTVAISGVVNDADTNAVKIKVKYKSGSSCTNTSVSTTTLSSTVTATYGQGSITVNADSTGYQLQAITTASGANTLGSTWNSQTDVPTADGTYCVFLTPNDGYTDGTTVSSTVILDNVAPTAPGKLTVNATSTNNLTLAFGTASTETNFKEYKIFYKNASSGVTQSDTSFTSSTDSHLGSRTYGGATTAALVNLTTSTQYVFNIWAYDTYGNVTTSTTELAVTSLANNAGILTVSPNSSSALNLTIDTNTNPSSVTYSLYNSTTGNYLAADGSSTASPVYQTTSTWGSSFVATGLNPNISYQFVAVARNGDGVNTTTSTANTAVYTLASVPSGVTIETTGLTGQLRISWNANNNPAGTIYYGEETGNVSINSNNITDTSWTVSGLSTGQTYTFHVKAINSAVISTAYSSSVTAFLNSSGGAAPTTPAPTPTPPPAVFGDDIPKDIVIEDFAPTGLIKFISSAATDIDVLSEAGLSSPYKVKTKNDMAVIKNNSDLLNLQSPFTMDFSFVLNKDPRAPGDDRGSQSLFNKNGAYSFGIFAPDSGSPSLCFYLSGQGGVCDKMDYPRILKVDTSSKPGGGFFGYNYHVNWNGKTLDLSDDTTKYDSQPVSSIPSSGDPIVLGGRAIKLDTATIYNYYPATFYKLHVKSEPLLVYTNKPTVKLKVDATYAPELALKESSDGPSGDFSSVSFQPVTSELTWTLQGADGKKCVNARFNSQAKKYKYDTYACIILDTIKPSADFSFDSGLDAKGVSIGSSRIFGISEADAQVTITQVLKQAASSSLALAAAPIPTIINLKANKDGTWSYVLSDSLQSGLYTFTVQSKDLAGNVSDLVVKDAQIKKGVVKKDDKPKIDVPIITDPIIDVPPIKIIPKKPVTKEPVKNIEKTNQETATQNTNVNGQSNSQSSNTSNQNQTVSQIFNNVIQKITQTGLSALAIATAFFKSPFVQAVNTKAVVPLLAMLGLANVVLGFQLPQIINILRYLFGQPSMLWRRRKQKTWGVVYSAYSKLPVDLATIRLIEESTGRVLTSQVTDMHGRYFMSANVGQYRLEVIKPGFVGFSEHLRETDEDAKFINLYHGAAFYAPRDQFEINYNIPLDPVDVIKSNAKILREHIKARIQYALSFIGLAASLMSFAVTPGWYTASFIILHIGLFVLFYFLGHKKLPATWGEVRSLADKSPIGRAVVRVFDSAYNKLVDTAVTDKGGRYAILVGPSIYYTTYEREGFAKKQSPVLDYSSDKTNGMGGIINRDELLTKN